MARRKFWNCPQNVRESVYTTIIRPKLEYSCAAWDPHHKKDIMTLEKVQIKGARFCIQNYVPLANVKDMLGKRGWETLQQRRMKTRLTMIYQNSYNRIDFNAERYLIPHTDSRTRVSHPLKLQIPKEKKDVFKYFYIHRTIKTGSTCHMTLS